MIIDGLDRIPMGQSLAATLSRAASYADAQAHPQVTLEHLLLALTEDPDAIQVLRLSNVDLARLAGEVSNQLGRIEERRAGPQTQVLISEDLKRILNAAAAAARQGRRSEINGAIVLAAIVGDAKSAAAHLLRAEGLTFEEAIRALQRASQMATSPAGSTPGPTNPSTEDILANARQRVQTRSAAPRSRSDAASEIDQSGYAAPSPPAAAPPVMDVRPEPSDPRQSSPPPDAPRVEPTFAPPMEPSRSSPPVATAPMPGPMTAPALQVPHSAAARPHTGQPAPRGAHDPEGRAASAAGSLKPQWETMAPMPKSAPPPPIEQRQRPPGVGAADASSPRPPPPQSWEDERRDPRTGPPPDMAQGSMAHAESLGTHLPRTGPPSPPPAVGSPPLAQPFPPQGGARPGPPTAPPYSRHSGPPPVSGTLPPGAGAQRRATPPGAPGQPMQQRSLGQPPGVAHGGRQRQQGPASSVRVAAGQLVENIPRRMRAFVPVVVEARVARAEVKAIAEGMQGGGAVYRHEVTVTKAMSVRLRAPEGGFFIETASPETQWIDNVLGVATDDFASWRWTVTPNQRGKKRLQLLISARTVGADGLAAETALPDQVIEVKVGINYARTAMRWGGWIAAALVGGVLARFGETLTAPLSAAALSLIGG